MNVAPQDAVLLVGLTAAAATDAWSGRVPNALTFPMVALGIAIVATTSATPLAGLIGCAAAFAIHYPLYVLGTERAGDAKLMMGVGACVGWQTVIEASLWLAVLYLPLGLLVLAVRGRLGNLVAVARYQAAKRQGKDPGPQPELTWLRTAPVIAVGGALAWATDWLAVVH